MLVSGYTEAAFVQRYVCDLPLGFLSTTTTSPAHRRQRRRSCRMVLPNKVTITSNGNVLPMEVRAKVILLHEYHL